MKLKSVFLMSVLLIAIFFPACSKGLTTVNEISAFVYDNLSEIKSGDVMRILAISDELSIMNLSSGEYTAFICGSSGIGPDGTYYGFYLSADGLPHEMQGCNEYRTEHITENIYYFEYTVY